MALEVEDGTAKVNAESFASVDEFTTHHTLRGNTYTATDSAIEAALRKATDFMEARWSTSWVGSRSTVTQALSWPRDGAYYPDDGRPALDVPIEIKRACVEYALRALTNELAPDLEYTTTLGPVVETEDRVGPIMERRKYANGGATMAFRKFPVIDKSLRPLLVGGGGDGYLLRV